MLYNNGAGRGGSFTAIAPNSATIQEISYETGGLSAESELAGIRTAGDTTVLGALVRYTAIEESPLIDPAMAAKRIREVLDSV